MTVNVGILGFAHSHVDAYCDAWREDEDHGIDVRIGWDHDRERRQMAAGQHEIDTVAQSEELLDRDDLDAVVVGAETAHHADLVEAAAAAGKAIVLQKPVALTLPEADRIVEAVDIHDVPFTMAWQMREDPQNRKIKELIDSGELGQIFKLRRRHGLSTHLWDGFADTWHVDPGMNRDIWADDASHPIDFVYWLFGEPESVTAEIMSLHDPAVPMDNGTALFRYPDGPLVEVSCSFTNPAAENTTEVVAEHGSIVQNYGDGPSCNVPRPDDAPGLKWYRTDEGEWTISDLETPDNHGDRIQALAGPLAEFLRGERAPIATAADGRNALRMALACYVSVREGRRVGLRDPAVTEV